MLQLSSITNAFVFLVVVSSVSRSNNESHAFETTRIRFRRSHLSRHRSLNEYHSSTHLSRLVLGWSKADDKNTETVSTQHSETEIGYNDGLLVLATVPVAWGTFEPAVRLVYKYEPLMPPLLFSFAYYLVATCVLTIGRLYSVSPAAFDANDGDRGIDDDDDDDESSSLTTTNSKDFGYFWGLPLSTRGGIELGTYLFIGNAFQVIGLKTVPSDRAAFLLQLTTIFVALLKSVKAETLIPRQTWIACLVALMGVALIGLDDDGAGPTFGILETVGSYSDILHKPSNLLSALPVFSVDDGYIVLAAVFYTFHCVRLENYARSAASAIGLATTKATTEMILSGFVIIACICVASAEAGDIPALFEAARTSGEKIILYEQGVQQQISSSSSSSSWPSLSSGGWPTVGLATFWVGAVTVAYTIYAQSFGQSKVSAVIANLIYSSQPIFTAMVAYFLLGESLGPNGYIGGLLIGAAVLLVIAAETETETEE